MSLKRATLANYASQIYASLIGILILPLYVRLLGSETYGLVAFFSMLQAWFSFLDIGLTQTTMRETSRFKGNAIDARAYAHVLRKLQRVFWLVAVLGGGGLLFAAPSITQNWLTTTLPAAQVHLAVQIMAVSIALRWITSFHRACIAGSERFVWLSSFSIAFATLRFIGVLPLITYTEVTPTIFFSYQLAVACLELWVVTFKHRSIRVPRIFDDPADGAPAPPRAPAALASRFSLALALTSTLWVVTTQVDKLILSNLLPLAEYGKFTLAVLAASGILMIGSPLTTALMPRMTILSATGQDHILVALYRKMTQFAVVLTTPVVLVLVLHPEKTLWIWTGDIALAGQAAQTLQTYALGNFFLGLTAMPLCLQMAKGYLRLHWIGSIVYVVALILLLLNLIPIKGFTGAGMAWLIVNTIYFFVAIPLIHGRLLPSIHARWLAIDIGVIAAAGTCAAVLASHFVVNPQSFDSRVGGVLQLSLVGLLAGAACVAASSAAKAQLRQLLRA